MPTLRENVRAMPRAAWILFGGAFINRFGSFVVPFLLLYLRHRGYSIPVAGAATSAYGAGALVSSITGGWVADRLGRRNAIALSMFSSAASMIALSQARSLAAIIPFVVLTGICSELYRPASSALVADLIPEERRVTGFALYRLGINLGFAFGPATAGFLARHSYTLLFVGDAVTSAAFGVLALAALPTGVRSARSEEQRGEATRTILADRVFLAFLFASVAVGFIYFQGTSTLALHVKASGMSEAVYGSLISINGLVIVFIELPITAFTQRLPAHSVMVIGVLLTGTGFALTGLAHAYAPLAATVVVWTLGEIVNAPVASAWVAGLAPAHMRGRYSGAWGLTWSIALMIGPSLGSLLYSRNQDALWALCLALGVFAGVLIVGSAKRVRAPAPEAALA